MSSKVDQNRKTSFITDEEQDTAEVVDSLEGILRGVEDEHFQFEKSKSTGFERIEHSDSVETDASPTSVRQSKSQDDLAEQFSGIMDLVTSVDDILTQSEYAIQRENNLQKHHGILEKLDTLSDVQMVVDSLIENTDSLMKTTLNVPSKKNCVEKEDVETMLRRKDAERTRTSTFPDDEEIFADVKHVVEHMIDVVEKFIPECLKTKNDSAQKPEQSSSNHAIDPEDADNVRDLLKRVEKMKQHSTQTSTATEDDESSESVEAETPNDQERQIKKKGRVKKLFKSLNCFKKAEDED